MKLVQESMSNILCICIYTRMSGRSGMYTLAYCNKCYEKGPCCLASQHDERVSTSGEKNISAFHIATSHAAALGLV